MQIAMTLHLGALASDQSGVLRITFTSTSSDCAMTYSSVSLFGRIRLTTFATSA